MKCYGSYEVMIKLMVMVTMSANIMQCIERAINRSLMLRLTSV